MNLGNKFNTNKKQNLLISPNHQLFIGIYNIIRFFCLTFFNTQIVRKTTIFVLLKLF
jgi:hypothetical protein